MLTPSEADEYLAEIRSQVCANCVERPSGGPPCQPLGIICGIEQHLPELVDAIHDVFSPAIAPYFESKQRQVCDHCSFKKGPFCPCPMDYLLVLVVEAVEAVDARRERRQRRLQRLRLPKGDKDKAEITEIRELYQEARGTWTGCDWQTSFGKLGLDLKGWTAVRARARAATCESAHEAAEWQAAAEWLATVEQTAQRAEEHAASAVRAAAAGAWLQALDQARLAWSSEFATGRMIWRGFPMTWQRLFLAIEEAVPLHDDATDADQAIALGQGFTSSSVY